MKDHNTDVICNTAKELIYEPPPLFPLGLGLDPDAPSLLDLDSELTNTLDLDLDLDREQQVSVAVISKLAHDMMLDLLRLIDSRLT